MPAASQDCSAVMGTELDASQRMALPPQGGVQQGISGQHKVATSGQMTAGPAAAGQFPAALSSQAAPGMQQRMNRIAPVAKPLGIDPLTLLQERENRCVFNIRFLYYCHQYCCILFQSL